jgi:hypothetical protein
MADNWKNEQQQGQKDKQNPSQQPGQGQHGQQPGQGQYDKQQPGQGKYDKSRQDPQKKAS